MLSGYLYESEIGEANLAFTRLRYSVKHRAGAAPQHLERWRPATAKVRWGKTRRWRTLRGAAAAAEPGKQQQMDNISNLRPTAD